MTQEPEIDDVIDSFKKIRQLAILPETAKYFLESTKDIESIRGIDSKTLERRWLEVQGKGGRSAKKIVLPLSEKNSYDEIVKSWPKDCQCSYIIKYVTSPSGLTSIKNLQFEEVLFMGATRSVLGLRSIYYSLHNPHQIKIHTFGAQYHVYQRDKVYPLDGLVLELVFSGEAQKTANDLMKEYVQRTGDKPLLNRMPKKRVPKAWIEIELAESLQTLHNEMGAVKRGDGL